MKLKERCRLFCEISAQVRQGGIYPYFRPISCSQGSEVEVGGRKLIMIGSNDYLGLAHDPRVKEASAAALLKMGTASGGSRFLSGNMVLHENLEERLAAFVGKKYAVLHSTGFCTNLGSLGALVTPADTILVDKECHASIIAGAQYTRAKMKTFTHNDVEHARKRAAGALKNSDVDTLLITEGVFSMSGDVAPLDKICEIRDEFPALYIYLDDAHGLGVLGQGGRGTAAYFGVTDKIDFIMGTFSKSFASVGGFIAANDEDLMDYVRHQSRTQIFSAGLPAANTAAVLACLDILEREPGRVERLMAITQKMRKGYKEIGLRTYDSISPIIPIHIGSDEKAFLVAAELFERGIFALPAIYPAVPRGGALIRTAYMSTHRDEQLDFVLNELADLAKKYKLTEDESSSEYNSPQGSYL